MRPEIIINSLAFDAMITHCRDGLPIEACGYLGGKDGEVSHCFPLTNTDAASDHFTFDPKEQFATVKQARALGIDLLGVFHSHPETPARLSAEDIRLFNDPHMQYWIVSFSKPSPEVGAFMLKKTPDSVDITVMHIVIK